MNHQVTHNSVGMTAIMVYSGSVQLGVEQSQLTLSSGDPVDIILDRASVKQSTLLKGMLYCFRIHN